MKTRETRIFILFLTAIIMMFVIFAVVTIQTAKITAYYTNKHISLPEEIELAKCGDVLQVEKVTTDSIYLGFKK